MAIVNGKAYWASVTTPNTTFEPVYTVDLVVSDEVAQEFEKRGVKVKDFSLKDESGEQQYVGKALTIKRKVNGKKGPRPAPKLVDRNKVEISTKVGNGSEVDFLHVLLKHFLFLLPINPPINKYQHKFFFYLFFKLYNRHTRNR